MFRGRYEHSLDAKGRTSVPARFRELFARRSPGPRSEGERLVLAPGLERCLMAYPADEWLRFESRLAELPQFDPSVVRLKRLVVSGAVECQVDRQGRILLPPALRSHAVIARDLIWAGMVGHVELWAAELWRDATQASSEELSRLAKALGDLGL